MTLKINEIFYSIQGEASRAGSPCVFIRLSGCNLRCRYCDTTYAYEEGEQYSIDRILADVEQYGCSFVTVTGGEPLMQEDTPLLIRRLLEQGYTVFLETNGSVDISGVDERCVRVVDIKCPSSGESERNNVAVPAMLSGRDEIKCVIAGRQDYEYAKNMIMDIRRRQKTGAVHMSPVSGVLDPAELAAWILEDGLDVRLNIQLHKVIWPDKERGY